MDALFQFNSFAINESEAWIYRYKREVPSLLHTPLMSEPTRHLGSNYSMEAPWFLLP